MTVKELLGSNINSSFPTPLVETVLYVRSENSRNRRFFWDSEDEDRRSIHSGKEVIAWYIQPDPHEPDDLILTIIVE